MKKTTSFLFYFLFFGANAAYMPYLVLWFQSLDFSGAQIGVLTSLFPLLAMVGVPLWTGLADATRRHRLIMSLSMLVPIGVGLLMPELTSFLPVLILVILFAFFGTPVNAFADSATMAMLGERKELYGRVRLGGTFGWGIASLLFGALIEDHGLRLGFYSFAGVSCLALLVSQGFSFKQAESRESFLSGARTLLANHRFMLFLLMAMVCGIGLSMVNNYLFAYMEELHATRSAMGLAQTLATLSELPVLLFSSRLLKRLKPHSMLMMGMGFIVLRLLVYAAISTPQGVLVSQLMNGLTYAVVWVAGVSYVDQTAPTGISATGQGLFGSMVFGVGSAIGGFSGSMLLEGLGGRGMFGVTGLFMLVIMGVLLVLERRCAPAVEPAGVVGGK
jgi:PPP family 3-phenylpropionic acid transporter